MRRICFFSGDITRSGGTEKVAVQIMNGLVKENDVSVLSLTMSAGDSFFEIDERIKAEALFQSEPNGIRQYAQIVHRLRQYLRREKIEVLIDVDTILDMFSVPAVKLFPAPQLKLISWEHFNFYESMGNRFRVPIRKLITKQADAVVTLTKEDQRDFENYYKGKTKIKQIYNPILKEKSRVDYDISSKTIISVGRLSRQKGFDYLVDIARLIQEKHPDWQWLILGEGEERPLLEAKIAELGVSIVRLVGKVDNVADYLGEAAIFVLTSRYEGFPLVLIEAKANRLPIVSFKCKTGPAELVQDGINGYLVDCFDIQEMADSIIQLIENDEIRYSFSNKAELDTEKMNYKGIMEQWRQLLNELN